MFARGQGSIRAAGPGIAFGAVVLLSAALSLAEEQKAKPAESDRKAQLAERDRLWDDAQKLRAAGKLVDAAATGQKMLAIERLLFPADSDELIGSLNWLAGVHEAAEDWPAAESARADALSWLEKYRGPEHWATIEGRLALANGKKLQTLTAAQRSQLRTAEHLQADVDRFYPQGKYTDAIKAALRAAEIREQVLGKQHPDYAASLNYLALLYKNIGDYARAEPLYRQAMLIRKQVLGEQHPDYAQSLSNLGMLYISKGDYVRAEPLCRQAMEIRKQALGGQHPDYARSLNNLAGLYDSMGDYARAEPLYRQAMETMKQVLGEQHPDYASSLNNLALLYTSVGNYARAEPLYRQAMEIRKRSLGEQHSDYASSLNNLALLYMSTGNYARAEPLYRQAMEIWKQALGEQHSDYATSLSNLAGLYESMGDYARAEPLYRQTMEIKKQALGEQHPDYALSLNNLAFLYYSMRDYTRAEPLYRQAMEIHKLALRGKHPRYATDLNNLAALYDSMGDYARAEPLYREALEIRKQSLGERHPDYALSLNNLAMLHYSMGDYARAEPLYHRALEIRKLPLGEQHPDYATSLSNLAALYDAMGDYARAEPLYRQTLAITRASLEATSLVQSERQQLLMGQGLRYQLDAYVSLGLAAGEYARDIFANVLKWKGATLVRQRGMRQAAADPNVAQSFGELQQAVRQLASLSRAVPENEEQRDAWRKRLAELNDRKERLESELSDKSAAFRQATKEVTLTELLAALPADAVLVDFLEFGRFTPPKAKGQKSTWERQLVAFVVRHAAKPGDEMTMLALGPVAPISTAIDTWRTTYGSSADGAAAGRLLRETLWQPLLPTIGSAKTILVSTDGVLGELPLAALPGKATNTFLIEDYRLAMIPVPKLLPQLVAADDAQPLPAVLLTLGNLDYDHQPSKPDQPTPPIPDTLSDFALAAADRGSDGEHFGRLPDTLREIEAVESLMRKQLRQVDRPVVRLEGAAASKERVVLEMSRCEHLHLATHGFFALARFKSAEESGAERPGFFGKSSRSGTATFVGFAPGLLSGLVLSGANLPPVPGGDDGILTAEEIACLPLDRVRLATLSACETGLGKRAGGEGLLGIQRAFQVSGVRSTVASYWKVDDAVTRHFMELFYSNLWEKKLPALDSLREAQLQLLRQPDELRKLAARGLDLPEDAPQRSSSRFWAAFTLSGDWR